MNGHDQQLVNRRLAADYLAWLGGQRNRSQQTVYEYGGKLEAFLCHVGPRRLDAMTLAECETFVSRPKVRGQGPRAAATVAYDVAVLKSFYCYLRGHGKVALTDDPTALLQGPKIANRNPKALDDDVWLAAWSCGALSAEERALLGMGYLLGLRREEMTVLGPLHVSLSKHQLVGFRRKGGGDDVLPYGSCVRIIAEHRKTAHLLPDPSAFLDAFEGMARERGGSACRHLLPWGSDPRSVRAAALRSAPGHRNNGWTAEGQTSPNQINKRLRYLLVKAGLPEGAFTPHALRHSFVTNLLRAEVPIHVVSRLANHSSIDITMRYVKTAIDPLAEYLAPAPDGRLGGKRWG